MNNLVIYSLLTIYCCHVRITRCQNEEDPLSTEIDRSGYVDPGDMINFDYAKYKRQMEEEANKQVEQKQMPVCKDPYNGSSREDSSAIKKELLEYKQQLQEYRSMLDKRESNPRVDAFFRRLAVILSNRGVHLREDVSLLSSSPSAILKYDISDKFLTRIEELKYLLDRDPQTPSSKYVDQVSDIIIPLINKSYVDPLESFWVRNFDSVCAVALISVFIMMTYLITQQRIKTVVVLLFFLAVTWEWKRLYEDEVARIQRLERNNLSEVCQKESFKDSVNNWLTTLLTGVQSLVMITSHADSGSHGTDCHQHYSSVGVRSILNVNPSLAVSNVIGYLFGNSFSVLSKYTGQGFQNFFAHVPLLWTPVVVPLVFMTMIFLLTFLCGYDIRSPFLSLVRSRHSLSFPGMGHTNDSSQAVEQPSTVQSQSITYNDNRVIHVQRLPDSGDPFSSSLPFNVSVTPGERRAGGGNILNREISQDSSSSIEFLEPANLTQPSPQSSLRRRNVKSSATTDTLRRTQSASSLL